MADGSALNHVRITGSTDVLLRQGQRTVGHNLQNGEGLSLLENRGRVRGLTRMRIGWWSNAGDKEAGARGAFEKFRALKLSRINEAEK